MESIRFRGGYTLIELLVVFTIIVVITAVVLASQGNFNKTLVIANTAYDVALALRSAETFGLGSRAFGTTVNAGYGLHFESGTPGSFTLFIDTYPPPSPSSVCHPTSDASAPSAQSGNCAYDTSPTNERVQTYTLGNGITVGNFCAKSSNSWSCVYPRGAYSGGLSSLDIVFARPNPTPFMSKDGVYSTFFPLTAACLVITSPQGGEKYISVVASGQISANAATCP